MDEEAWRYGESVEHILSELAREVRDGSPPVTRVMRRGLRCRLWTRSAALDPQRTPALGELAGAARWERLSLDLARVDVALE